MRLMLTLFLISVTLGTVTPDLLSAQETSRSSFDPPEPSAAFDLKDLPLGIALFQMSALKLTDASLEGKFNSELATLTSEIKSAIEGKSLGYLAKVELYSDEFGTPIVPSGQIIFPIGVGTEPADSLAEFIRRPRLEGPTPNGVKNESYYLWIKAKDGKLIASGIPREFRERLELTARGEATRRNLLGEWERSSPSGIKSVQRAEYWTEVSAKYRKYVSSKQKQAKIDSMIGQFNRA
jgi:hypothetical protein